MRARFPTRVAIVLAAVAAVGLAACGGPAPETGVVLPTNSAVLAGDSYVGSQPIYSGIWMPGTDGQQVELGLGRTTFSSHHTSWTNQGYRLVTLTARYSNGQ